MNQNYSSQQQQNYAQPGSRPMAAQAPPLEFEVWGGTDKGRQREGNEDAVYPHSGAAEDVLEPGPQQIAQKGRLLIVADGVGGAQAGSQASRWAIRVAVETYYDQAGANPGANLRAAIEKSNASLYQYLQSTGTQEAGCTMTAVVIHGNTLHVANVGDSRVYLVRNSEITQLTRDHTLTQQKLDRGLIRPDQVEMDPDRSVLTRSMGAGPTVRVDVFPAQQLAPGDSVLLCSDGVTDMLDDGDIARIVKGSAPKRAVKKLIDAANKNGGFDNISAVVAHAGGKGASGAGALGGLSTGIQGMGKRQKMILGVGGALVALALCAMTWLGWSMWSGRGTPTPTATPVVATVETTPTATEQTAAPATEVQPTDTVPAGAATSTPMPTATPTNTPPPPDRDGDGIPDHKDECPDQFGLIEFKGCPDSDGDGIPDHRDNCPDKPGEFEGCPDSDGDGIPDHRDNCPDQSGPADNGGCPESDNGGGNGGNGGNGPKPEPTKKR